MISIGGVEEYFNFPVKQLVKQTESSLNTSWIAVPQGTGELTRKLDSGELEIAILLSEGAVKSIYDGAALKIVSNYVQSPVQWGIFTAPHVVNFSIHELTKVRIAISKRGSGSHLMAIHLALIHGIPVDQLHFVEVQTLAGAIHSFQQGSTDLFMWEKYTADILVKQGVFSLFGIHPTPWSGFVLAASNSALSDKASEIHTFLLQLLTLANAIQHDQTSFQGAIASMFGLEMSVCKEALSQLMWNDSIRLPTDLIPAVTTVFQHAGIIKKPLAADSFFYFF